MQRTTVIAVCLAFGLVLTGVAAGSGLDPVPADHDGAYEGSDRTYAVQQGDRCIEVRPLGDGTTPVESFYAYRNSYTNPGETSYTSYSAYGAHQVQENQVSTVFIYDGTDGESLVFVHDERGGDAPSDAPFGGAVSVDLRGLPDGEWVVRDDWYAEGSQKDRWQSYGTEGNGYTVDWLWRDGRTDGGAYLGLERLEQGDAVRIAPAFNQDAGLWNGALDNATDVVQRWQFVDGTGRHVELTMSEPIAVGPGPCQEHTLERIGPGGYRLSIQGDGQVNRSSRYLPPPRTGNESGVHLSSIGVATREPSASIDLATTQHTTRPPLLPPVPGVTTAPLYVTIAGRQLDAVETITVQFDVEKERYVTRDLDPERVGVHQYRNGSWHELSTDVFETRESQVIEAAAADTGPLAVTTRDPDVRVSIASASRTIVQGEIAVLQAQLVNRGHASDTVPVTFTVRGTAVERRNVTVSAGSTQTVEFDRKLERTGTWELGVNDQLVDVHVEAPRPRLAVNSLDVEPSRVEAGEPIQVAATVENVGQESGAVTVNLRAFGTTVESRSVTLAPGEERVVTFARTIDAPGTHTFRVENETVEVVVSRSADAAVTTSTDGEVAGWTDRGGVQLVLSALILAFGLVLALWLRW